MEDPVFAETCNTTDEVHSMRSPFNDQCKRLRILGSAIGLAVAVNLPAQGETLDTKIGKLDFEAGYPTPEAVEKLYDELDFQRAVQAYLWALPMASYGAMADAHKALGADSHTVIIADELAEPRQLALTANQDTVYMSGVLDLREGPMVMELPPGLLGTMNNVWQQPLVDLGGPFSPEQNRGGKFLILPPGYDGPLPETHHHIAQSDTNIVVFYLRAIPQTREDIPELVELIHTYRQYKLEDAAEPPETNFVSLTGKDADLLTNEGFAYFETLARYINENPPRSQDMAMLGMHWRHSGIAHGQPFEPDERMKAILTEAPPSDGRWRKPSPMPRECPKRSCMPIRENAGGRRSFSRTRPSMNRNTWPSIFAASTPSRRSAQRNPWSFPCPARAPSTSVLIKMPMATG
jgi:hypothetical protein